MKHAMIIMAILMIGISLQAQNLIETYKKGTIKLVPDTEYAKGNNWDKVFETFNDTLYGKHMGFRKNIRLLPDGSVVIDHPYRNLYTKFSPNGIFEKEFQLVNSKGVPFKKTYQIAGVINNNTFFTN
ncbi:MAG: hypothetical protein JW735_11420, partial [Prolixibacteraceae bacterium]|nr:hypothetical protein [Prolixibacteraceae bacterium]